MSVQPVDPGYTSFDALFSDAGVELERAMYAARRLVSNLADDVGEHSLGNVIRQRECEGAVACLVSQLEKAVESHGRAEIEAQREKAPPKGSGNSAG